MWFNILRDRKGGGLDGIIVALIMVALVLILLLGGVWQRLRPEINGLIDASAQKISEYSNTIIGSKDETGDENETIKDGENETKKGDEDETGDTGS